MNAHLPTSMRYFSMIQARVKTVIALCCAAPLALLSFLSGSEPHNADIITVTLAFEGDNKVSESRSSVYRHELDKVMTGNTKIAIIKHIGFQAALDQIFESLPLSQGFSDYPLSDIDMIIVNIDGVLYKYWAMCTRRRVL